MNDGVQLLIIYDESKFDNKLIVEFLMKKDKKNAFYFATMESYIAQVLMSRNNLVLEQVPILVSGEKIYTRTDVLVRTAPHLQGYWKALSLLRLLPRSLRNKIVTLILNNN